MERTQEAFTQDEVRRVVGSLRAEPAAEPARIEIREHHATHLAEVQLEDGRTLMIKRARYAEMAERFRVARTAAELLRERTDVIAPEYLELPGEAGVAPMLAYWRISDPTLAQVWDDLDERSRQSAIRSAGALMRRVHEVRLPGHGRLLAARAKTQLIVEFLRGDLLYRLVPSAEKNWPAGKELIEALWHAVPRIEGRTSLEGCLVHNSLSNMSVLCSPESGDVRCIGVIDLENAFAGPPEADIAKTEILQGPLFGGQWSGDWVPTFLDGYEVPLDSRVIEYFRIYDLLDIGAYAGETGQSALAGEIAAAARRELDALGSGRRHVEVVST